jgi:hypothetical protein
MTPDCNYVLDNNSPCRCPALRGDRFCRHHTPETLARRNRPTPESPASKNPEQSHGLTPSALRGYWRSQHRWIATETLLQGLDDCFTIIIESLDDHLISPRSAGRLIAAILARKATLQLQAQEERLRAMMQHGSSPHPAQPHSVVGSPVLKPSANYSVSVQVA